MKKVVIFVISLLLVGVAGVTSAYAAKFAVLVIGLETDAASDLFALSVKFEFTQKGDTLVDNDAVKAKLQELRDKHAEGKPVDTVGLATWCRTNKLDFVQLVVENGCDITIGTSTLSGREQIMQVVSGGTTKYSGRGYYRTRFIPRNEKLDNEILKDMVPVVGGVLQMRTTYYVQLSSFYIGKYAVTQALWKKVMGDLPSTLKNDSSLLGDNKPVVYVSWNEIAGTGGFLEMLNAQTGQRYRLPTEAEWEYAARGCNAGSCDTFAYSGSDNVADVSWHMGNSGLTLHEVGEKLPNGLGLYDMSGNVGESCSDWYGSYGTSTVDAPAVNPTGPTDGCCSNRVNRGGGWHGSVNYSLVTERLSFAPSYISYHTGFRLV
jgi:formylglycine-generating enzyme required for sulfatase activity